MMKMLKTGMVLAAMALAFVVAPSVTLAQAAEKMVNCKDGSTSKGGRGACSSHGGVVDIATAKSAKAAKAETKAAKSDAKAAKSDAKAATSDAKAAKSTKAAKSDAKAASADAKSAKSDAKAAKAAKSEAKEAKTAAAPKKAGEGKPTARCTDGTMSYAKNHTGACSSHGGVAEWLDGTKKP